MHVKLESNFCTVSPSENWLLEHFFPFYRQKEDQETKKNRQEKDKVWHQEQRTDKSVLAKEAAAKRKSRATESESAAKKRKQTDKQQKQIKRASKLKGFEFVARSQNVFEKVSHDFKFSRLK